MDSSGLPLVLLTNAIDPTGEAILRQHARLVVAPDTSAATLNSMARQACGIIVRVPLPRDIIDHAPQLRGIARHGVGLDMVPMAAATARRIPVSYVPGANAAAVAEYCFGAALSLDRRVAEIGERLRRDGWSEARAMSDTAGELCGKTLGIVGFGNVGQHVARIGGAGFGMKVIATTRSTAKLPPDVAPVTLIELFQQAELIIVSCPLNEETRGMVNATVLSQVRPRARLINVSRGAVIDDGALADVLLSGRLAGAALDVFTVQPLPRDHVFFEVPNLLLTPHLAGLTQEAMVRMSTVSATDMARMLNGFRPVHFANPEIDA